MNRTLRQCRNSQRRGTRTAAVVLVLLVFFLSGCGVASITIEKTDGTTIRGFGVAFLKDVALEGLKYETPDRTLELGAYNSRASEAAIAALERIATGIP